MSLVYLSKKLKYFYKSKSENKVVQNCLKHLARCSNPELCLLQFYFSKEAAKAGERRHVYELAAG